LKFEEFHRNNYKGDLKATGQGKEIASGGGEE
jgi:hypothetical protein